MDESEIKEFAELLFQNYSTGARSLDAICSVMLRMGAVPRKLSAARQIVEDQIRQIRSAADSDGLIDPDVEGWYAGPIDGDGCWAMLTRGMLESGWKREAVDELDGETTRIVSLLAHPAIGQFRRKGLVVGYVQSGKTANFMGVIAKAADAGYRLFIVLSGVTNKLRRQTQDRFDTDLLGRDRSKWISLTTDQNDFDIVRGGNVDAFLMQHAQQKTICIVKKIPLRLQRLGNWLQGANPTVLESCPVLIIDDEADEASINTSKVPDVRTKANAQVCRLVNMLPRVSYVGYTATPFANIFIDPSNQEDLYPRDFIVDLRRKDSYFGAERIFGRGDLSPDEAENDRTVMDVVSEVPEAEASLLRPPRARPPAAFRFDVEQTPTLRHAIRWFWLATACRRLRMNTKAFHSSMLIHSHQATQVHNAFRRPLETFRDEVKEGLRASDGREVENFRTCWIAESVRVNPEQFGNQLPSFAEVIQALPQVVEDTGIVIENYTTDADERLSYDKSNPQTVIVVGGAILARGLTLEGLVASVFVRSASAYDTLLQMGRWFGYRAGYEELPRIWMTRELRDYFYDLATVEEEIRRDIARYKREGLTPTQFAPRIRTHPALMITSRLKMQNAFRCSTSFDEKRVQTTIFKHRDHEWLKANIAASRRLVTDALKSCCSVIPGDAGRRIINRVGVDLIKSFLRSYRIHERHPIMEDEALLKYVEAEVKVGSLLEWNVVIAGQSQNVLGTLDMGGGIATNLIRRSKLRGVGGNDFANVKALMQEIDICCDLRGFPSSSDRTTMFEARSRQLPNVGLLVLYPVSMSSSADPNARDRVDMDAVEHIIGLGVVLPRTARSSGSVDYMTADLSSVEVDEIELAPELIEESEA
jgi:hypothetical protein